MNTLTTEQLAAMMESNEDFALIEVLGPEAYDAWHLPGAINVPLGPGFDDRVQHAVTDKRRNVVVYCRDLECQASPRAARRMEALGFERVHDYEAGKDAWKAAGLRIEPGFASKEETP